jgi:hypothetical protein
MTDPLVPFGRNRKRAAAFREDDLPQIRLNESNDVQDLIFAIQEVAETPEGRVNIMAYGLHGDRKVGVAVSFRGGMMPGIVDDEIDRTAFYREGVSFSSVGEDSDTLLLSMASFYGATSETGRFVKRVATTSFALDGDPRNMMNEKIMFKVFFCPEGEDDKYAELYTNIDLPNRVLELLEKDEEYRVNIIKALTAPDA